MRRLSVAAFSVLVAATVAAFFIAQHLKVATPLLAGYPRPVPPVINPVAGRTCGGVNHRTMRISFYLLHRADDVDVDVVDSDGAIVRTLASDLHMTIKKRVFFVWNGRADNGSIAPDGTYYVRVALIHQGRTVTISGPSGPESFKIKTTDGDTFTVDHPDFIMISRRVIATITLLLMAKFHCTRVCAKCCAN